MFCPSCGQAIDPATAVHCIGCGKRNHPACLVGARCATCAAAAPDQAGPAPVVHAHPPPNACPKCKAEIPPRPGVAPCPKCGRAVFLVAGPGAIANLSAAPGAGPLPTHAKVRWPSAFTLRAAGLDQAGIWTADLDPIVAVAETGKVGIAYGDVMSIAGYRAFGWRPLIGVVLLLVPGAIVLFGGLVGGIGGAIVLGGLSTAFGALCVYAFFRRQRWLRIVGANRALLLRYDRPWRKTARFRQTVFARCGLPDPEA